MSNFFNLRIDRFFIIILFALVSCKSIENLPGGDARKNPPDPRERVKKNLEEGKGFRLDTALKGAGKGGDFMFASANELWRASLDTLDFMPLSSVNYSGGIIITDWYSDGNSLDESVKISTVFIRPIHHWRNGDKRVIHSIFNVNSVRAKAILSATISDLTPEKN